MDYAYSGDYTNKIITIIDDCGNQRRFIANGGNSVPREVNESQVYPGQYQLDEEQRAATKKREDDYFKSYERSAKRKEDDAKKLEQSQNPSLATKVVNYLLRRTPQPKVTSPDKLPAEKKEKDPTIINPEVNPDGEKPKIEGPQPEGPQPEGPKPDPNPNPKPDDERDDDQDINPYENQSSQDSDDSSDYKKKKPAGDDKRIPENKDQAKKEYVDNLLKKYTTTLEHDRQNQASGQQRGGDAHIARIEKRASSLRESKEQLDAHTLTHRTYEMSCQARGYMMANNMDYTAFDGASATKFQHCLTQEILGIIESSASMTQGTSYGSVINQLAQHNCNLAVSAQQLNKSSHIQEAVAITDLSHFFDAYTKLMFDHDPQSKMLLDASIGACQGVVRELQNCYEFGGKLYAQPEQTLGEIADHYKAMGESMLNIAKAISQAWPNAYLDDMMQDMQDRLNFMQHRRDDRPECDSGGNRMAQRTERNLQSVQDGLLGALQTAQTVIENMMQKSTRENAADLSQLAFENIITGKVAEGLLGLCQYVGNQALQVAENLEKIPPHLRGSKPTFVPTNTGEVIAIAGTAGEDIGAAIAAAGKQYADDLENFAKKAAQAHELARKGQGSTGGNNRNNKPKIEAVESYTYENGKYNPDTYHSKKGSATKSPCPKDGQAALDRSFEVEGSKERITTENGKIVVLRHEVNGVYHGYVVEDFFSIRNAEAQKALVKNGLVDSMKGGRIIK